MGGSIEAAQVVAVAAGREGRRHLTVRRLPANERDSRVLAAENASESLRRHRKQGKYMSDLSPTSKGRNAGPSRTRGLAGPLIVIILAVLMIVVVVLVPGKQRQTAATEAPPVNVTALPVTTVAQLPDTFDLPAVVEPNRIVTVAAEGAGRVERIPSGGGGPVGAGDVLVRLNTDLIEPQVRVAEAQYKRDKIQYERMAALVEGNATSPSELDAATNNPAPRE